MRTGSRPTKRLIAWAMAFPLCGIGTAGADDAKPAYPAMAPAQQYRMGTVTEEISLSRSAAPASISDHASILILGDRGYETAIKGENGFVCLVQRSWANGFEDAQFWNPKLRAPICLNAAAARTVLPIYLKRTEWVIAGTSKSDMIDRYRADLASNRAVAPESGAMSYMMSNRQYLGDDAGHWHPHLMFYFAHAAGADWGADLPKSPVFAAHVDPDPFMTFFILVPRWSDGTSAGMGGH